MVELKCFQLLLFQGGLCECGPHLLVDLDGLSLFIFVALNVESLEDLLVSRDDVLRPVTHRKDVEAVCAAHVREDGGIPVEENVASCIASSCAVLFDLDDHFVYRAHDHFSEVVFLHVDSFKALDLIVYYLGDSVSHDEVILLPDTSHAGAISGHLDAFSVEVDLYHVQVVVPWLDYVLPIQSDPL